MVESVTLWWYPAAHIVQRQRGRVSHHVLHVAMSCLHTTSTVWELRLCVDDVDEE